MYSSDFQKYLSEQAGIEFATINALFTNFSNAFEVAEELVNLHGIEKGKLGKIFGDYLGFAYVDPNTTIVNPEYVKTLGIDFIKNNRVLPLYKFGKAITVSAADPDNPFLQNKLEKALGEIVSLVFCFPSDIDKFLKLKDLK